MGARHCVGVHCDGNEVTVSNDGKWREFTDLTAREAMRMVVTLSIGAIACAAYCVTHVAKNTITFNIQDILLVSCAAGVVGMFAWWVMDGFKKDAYDRQIEHHIRRNAVIAAEIDRNGLEITGDCNAENGELVFTLARKNGNID